MRQPRLLFLVSGRNVPSTEYRILPFISGLRKAGFRCVVASGYPGKYDSNDFLGWRFSQKLKRLSFWSHLLRAKVFRPDIVVVERELFDNPTFDLEERFRRVGRHMVLDVDDAIFLRYPEKFAWLCRESDLVLAGNPNLVEYAQQYSSAVQLFPTVVDTKLYPLNHREPDDELPIVGWIGTDSNVAYLEQILPALCRSYERTPFRLRIVTGKESSVADLRKKSPFVEFRAWDSETATGEIARFSVGIMPLPDEEWARYKCGFKLLQYMAAGRAAIASPVGVNQEIIQHGENGFLASTETEWSNGLLRLLEDAQLRKRMGQAARKRVEEDFSVQSALPKLIDSFQKLLEQSKSG
ncbi:Glycosyl transferases group 1 [Thalassoglobus neptunius]|uniref:Glycosyl transferases group 1 n=1 Tax=Thalassoglobus neptunius TaxID=1938619 RepID=A0A5C5X4T8_9PLAN|nr:glycosyltransferase family 4 protein [Thalassoglobus neptunius]TWT57738.1 Glycosyl transferases group 1 [Thalassoglobus neptunius]